MSIHDPRNLRRGPWLDEEDDRLTITVDALGEKHWDALAKQSGLRRSGKSCRLRWMNYLRPNLKHGEITDEEEHIILNLHKQWGNKWSRIAKRLPGRTDNEIKNYWRSHLKKKAEAQQECFKGIKEDVKRDFLTTKGDRNFDHVGESSMNDKEDIFGISSMETPESCNMDIAFESGSPYESRMSDLISSCCWEGDQEVKHHEDCMGTFPCFCSEVGSSSEESTTHGVWDLWSPIWETG
ncbi:unnamed protein product [Lactuca virosa]|uniref:Uncharacterized protein n=1 Tax=Lactuca virosa TaxID=75947 RepID=A0AAU9M1K4_9ASTR|nr:unnamed protein product [Lactuca virosa]